MALQETELVQYPDFPLSMFLHSLSSLGLGQSPIFEPQTVHPGLMFASIHTHSLGLVSPKFPFVLLFL